ncbi:MAG: hypothetical protein AAFP90_01310 [Planctomycetota bacterium]
MELLVGRRFISAELNSFALDGAEVAAALLALPNFGFAWHGCLQRLVTGKVTLAIYCRCHSSPEKQKSPAIAGH